MGTVILGQFCQDTHDKSSQTGNVVWLWGWHKGTRNNNCLLNSPSVIYDSGKPWFESQSFSGNLDLKVVPSHSKHHFRFDAHRNTCMYGYINTHTSSRIHWVFALIAFSFLPKWNKRRAVVLHHPPDWMVIFIWVDMSSEVKNLTNKLATQFSPCRDKDTGVL